MTHKMSAREKRVSRAWMIEYHALESKPPRGVIILGGGLSVAAWLDEASRQGYYVDRPVHGHVTLH